jgi:NAD(P)-dependent dehydrogenase (short-subunit alcohol dehydrogenase family)
MNYLITGTNRGLGLELVREGARLGHEIIATCRSISKDLKDIGEEYTGLVHIIAMDVADTESVKRAFHEVAGKFDSLNGFINNAAVLYGSKYDQRDLITNIDINEAENTFNINITGVIRVMKYFMPLVYAASGERCIVNISTKGADLRDSGYAYASYTASKSALNKYTQCMRNYLALKKDTADIRVYMIHPGNMYTDMGIENAEIHPAEPARGIWSIIDRRKDVYSSIPVYDYQGNSLR